MALLSRCARVCATTGWVACGRGPVTLENSGFSLAVGERGGAKASEMRSAQTQRRSREAAAELQLRHGAARSRGCFFIYLCVCDSFIYILILGASSQEWLIRFVLRWIVWFPLSQPGFVEEEDHGDLRRHRSCSLVRHSFSCKMSFSSSLGVETETRQHSACVLKLHTIKGDVKLWRVFIPQHCHYTPPPSPQWGSYGGTPASMNQSCVGRQEPVLAAAASMQRCRSRVAPARAGCWGARLHITCKHCTDNYLHSADTGARCSGTERQEMPGLHPHINPDSSV